MEAMGPGERHFSLEEIELGDEYIQIVGEPAFVPQVGQVQRGPEGLDLLHLRLSLFARRAHCHQGIFDFPEGDQDRLLVLSQGLSGLSLCRPLLKSQDLGVEQGIREAGAYDAERRLIRDETREIRTRDAKYAGEGDFREALRLGDPDPSRRRMEILLHLDDIRAPLEQFRWKA